jgi:uncharacterized membrane protein (UPF0136 family)
VDLDGYYTDYPKDKKHLKFVVYSIYVAENIKLALSLHTAFTVVALDASAAGIRACAISGVFGGMVAAAGEQCVPRDTVYEIMSYSVAATVQVFFTYRIYILCKKAWPIAVILLLVLSSFIVYRISLMVLSRQAGVS